MYSKRMIFDIPGTLITNNTTWRAQTSAKVCYNKLNKEIWITFWHPDGDPDHSQNLL